MSIPLVFFDIDTQVDFMLPHGKLYVPGAEEIIPNLVKLMALARERDIPVISSADAHSPNDPEFAIWPLHCVVGTPGQRRIPETQFENATIVPCRPRAFAPPKRWSGQTILEKQTYDTADNPNFGAVLQSLGKRRAVVFGVATEFCVRASALALRQRGQTVDLVVDGIKGITEEGGQKALDELAKAGVRMVTTQEAIAAARS
jgi:nicotinamidase/pyrazinamidase